MSFLRITQLDKLPSHKTQCWAVDTADASAVRLGTIRWRGAWRCYAFFPEDFTVFEKKCLRELADFCEQETVKYRAGWKG